MSEPIQVHTGDGGVQAQILITVTDIKTDMAVVKEQMKAMPDHESRIRSLEKWRYGLPLAGLMALASLVIAAYGALHH
jgi:hypothetical protein